MNYKVRVSSEVESKEAQELFFELGFEWFGTKRKIHTNRVGVLFTTKVVGVECLTFDSQNEFDLENHQELTIPQLKDMVVLKRNDLNDRNVYDPENPMVMFFLDSSKKLFFFSNQQKWEELLLDDINDFTGSLLPIEKEVKMKEYLELQEDGGYKLVLRGSVCMESDIAVPHGSEAYIELKSGKKGFYKWHTNGYCLFDGYRHNFLDEFCHSIKSVLWVGELSNNHLKNYLSDVFWQRSETENKSQWDIQVGGDHYKSMKIQPAKFALENKLDYCQANAIKYICRHESKNGKQDLEKAKHYIDLLIEHYYGNS